MEGLQETARLIYQLDYDPAPDVLVVEADVLKVSAIGNLVDSTVEKWDRIDYAVNAAGKKGLDLFPRVVGII